jgi:hypothetical protein
LLHAALPPRVVGRASRGATKVTRVTRDGGRRRARERDVARSRAISSRR